MSVTVDTVSHRPKADIMDKPVSSSCCISSVEMNTIDLHIVIAGVINRSIYLVAQIKPKRINPLA